MEVVQVSGKAIGIEVFAIHISYCEEYAAVSPLKPCIFHLSDRSPSPSPVQGQDLGHRSGSTKCL